MRRQSHALTNFEIALLVLLSVPIAISQISCVSKGASVPDEEIIHKAQSARAIQGHLMLEKPPPEAALLESVLYQLTQADDVEAFAERRAIDLVDGRVRVVIELREDTEFTVDQDIIIESRYRHLVRVLTPIEKLLPLSQLEGVRFIRLPLRPVANTETVDE